MNNDLTNIFTIKIEQKLNVITRQQITDLITFDATTKTYRFNMGNVRWNEENQLKALYTQYMFHAKNLNQ